MPGISHSLGCKATDWLQGISSSFKKITLGVSVVILDGASIIQMLKGVGVSTVQYVISTFCAVYQVDLVCDTYSADSLKSSTKETRGTTPTGGSVHQLTAMPKNWQDFL